ncbi:MAG TPA: SusC/RagA family TonB-linked outer membrane protein [Chryseosolibacter sp.]|nr:SusC/RagA family TonB-linked outer membrane protein [Chryseosolibacter sp.]
MKKYLTLRKKLFKVMKLCASQFIIAIIICGVTAAHDNYGQVLERKVTLDIRDATISSILSEIEVAARVKFFYSIDHIDAGSRTSIIATDKPLRQVLNDLFEPFHIRYKVHEPEGTITLKKDARIRSHRVSDEHVNSPATDARSVSGVVRDAASSEPMAGVNIIVKGTVSGTSTASDGTYNIIAKESDVLVFSFIGYATFETAVGTRTVIDVELNEDVANLKEVVVNAGYYEVKEKESTGSIARLTAAEINKQPVSNPLLALQGRMPGVVISPRTGVAGSAQSIQIRGQNSLRADGNYPLYIIDGVPVDSRPLQSLNTIFTGGVDPLNTINPENIESIEILKDADATSIYGSRGANGVVLITTKKGQEGTTALDVQVYRGAGRVARMMDLLSTEEYLAMRKEAFANDGETALADLNNPAYAIYFPDMKLWDSTKYTNWQEELFGGAAQITDMQGSISGGNDKTTFRFGGGFHKEGTVFPGDFGYRKSTAHLSLTHGKHADRFKVSLSLNYGSDVNKLFNNNPVYTALTLAPNAPTYNDDGTLDWTGYNFSLPNPFSQLKIAHQAKTRNLITSARLSFAITDGLSVIANVGYNDGGTTEIIKKPKTAMPPGGFAVSTSSFGDRRNNSWIIEPQLSYSEDYFNHHLDVIAGTTFQATSFTTQWLLGSGYVSDNLLGNLNAASQVLRLGGDNGEYKYHAIFARAGYNYDGRYFLNLTARRDGSSRFGPENKFANFGAIGAAWIFTNEPFLSDQRVLSLGKFRGSVGTSGSDQIGDYGYLSTYSPSSATYLGGGILLPSGLANPTYAWEMNRKIELAVDLAFFNDRLSLTADWYLNRSSNQLIGYPLPVLSGFPSVQANLDATVENRGLEFMVTSRNFETSRVRWSTTLNLTIPRNELISFPNLSASAYANVYAVGSPLTIMKVYHAEGIDAESGLYTFKDVDGNDVINIDDRTAVLNLSRQYYGGINNSLSYRGFKLDFLVEIVKQDVTGYRGTFLQAPGAAMNQPSVVLEEPRWKLPGDNTALQRFTTNSTSYGNARLSNLNVDDGSFVRLKTISLSYSIPDAICSKIRLKDASVFVTGQNVFMLTGYDGLDPEIPGNSQLPQLRMMTAGINLKL